MRLEAFIMISLFFNAFFFMGGLAFDEIAEITGEVSPLSDLSNLHVSSFDQNGTIDGGQEAYTNALGEARDSSTDSDSGFFTDVFSSILNWVLALPGLSYILGPLTALPEALAVMFGAVGMSSIGLAMGYLWHGLTLVAIIIWVRG